MTLERSESPAQNPKEGIGSLIGNLYTHEDFEEETQAFAGLGDDRETRYLLFESAVAALDRGDEIPPHTLLHHVVTPMKMILAKKTKDIAPDVCLALETRLAAIRDNSKRRLDDLNVVIKALRDGSSMVSHKMEYLQDALQLANTCIVLDDILRLLERHKAEISLGILRRAHEITNTIRREAPKRLQDTEE